MSIQAGIYQHHHGNLYRVLGTATQVDNDEKLVVYQASTGRPHLYCRPESTWDDIVDFGGNVAEVGKPRFKFVSL